MFPNNKMKAVTFSYDDGATQDKRLIELFNRYNLKCTFNLNSGLQTGASTWQWGTKTVRRMNVEGLKELYEGHEIASHTLTHPRLEEQDAQTVINEISQDIINLERIFKCGINGFAYPYGTYDGRVIKTLEAANIRYARTVNSTHGFDVAQNLLELNPTCHHNDGDLISLAREFLQLKPDEPKIFYVWGHSYEFDSDNNWDTMERLCALISGKDDVFYGTNTQVLCNFW